jgi:hypothetical protein
VAREGNQRGEGGEERGVAQEAVRGLDWRWFLSAVVPEKKKEGRLEVGGGTDRGVPPVREKEA